MIKKIALILLIFNFTLLHSQLYDWESVRISGGGNVTSIIFHPKVENVIYITTDVGTTWRWNAIENKWEDMMLLGKIPVEYWRPMLNQAALNIAVDANDESGNILYAMVENGNPATFRKGMGKGGVLKSYDRGRSWVDCNLPITVLPNYGDKGMTDRIAVDPLNSNIIYVTSYEHGVFVNENGGDKGEWNKINTGLIEEFEENKSFDSYRKPSDIKFILLDKSKGKINNRTKRIFIGHRNGILISDNGGNSFQPLKNAPKGVIRGSIGSNGILYVSFENFNTTGGSQNSGIMKWEKCKWKNITPALPRFSGQKYKAVDVNPHNPKEVIVSETGTWLRDKMYITRNGGKTWITPKFTKIDNTEAPHSHAHDYDQQPMYNNNMFGWNPFKKGEVWYVDMIDVARTSNIWADSVHWKLEDKGLEEVIVTGPLIAPPFGKNKLLSVTADIGGADHRCLTCVLPHGINKFFFGKVTTGTNNSHVAFQQKNPDFIVRVGSDGWGMLDTADCRAGYSLDGGDSYQQFKSYPGVRGRVAVSAGSQNIVWITQANGKKNGEVFWSDNLGTTWNKSGGTPDGIIPYGSQWDVTAGANYIVADKVLDNTFYIFDRGKLFASSDGGKTFEVRNSSLPNGGTNPVNSSSKPIFANIDTNPEKPGDIWIAYENHGLFHSSDGGFTFEKVSPNVVKSPKWVALGKESPNGKVILFTTSTEVPINGVKYGVFRSDDMGRTWITIANPAPGAVLNLTADFQGRVFMGINGAGVFYGKPEK